MKKQRPSPKTLFGANTSSFYPCNGAHPLPIQTACSFYQCNGARPLPIRLEALRSFGVIETSSLGTVPNLHPPIRRVVSRTPVWPWRTRKARVNGLTLRCSWSTAHSASTERRWLLVEEVVMLFN
jgi:hypothetical protein